MDLWLEQIDKVKASIDATKTAHIYRLYPGDIGKEETLSVFKSLTSLTSKEISRKASKMQAFPLGLVNSFTEAIGNRMDIKLARQRPGCARELALVAMTEGVSPSGIFTLAGEMKTAKDFDQFMGRREPISLLRIHTSICDTPESYTDVASQLHNNEVNVPAR